MRYGLDIGGTKIEIVVFDQDFRVINTARIDTPSDNYLHFIQTVCQLVRQRDRQYSCIGSVGIGLPGVQETRSLKQISSNIPCLTGQHVAYDLAKELNRTVHIDNDSRCFALCEALTGAGKGNARVFAAVLGTGVGGGLVLDGKLYRGASGIAGEWGHMPISAHLVNQYGLFVKQCNCGLYGCLEHYISGTGLSNLCQYFLGEALQAEQFLKRVADKDAQALHVYQVFIDILCTGFANLQLTYDVDIIVLGGGLSNIKRLYADLQQRLPYFLFKGIQAVPIVQAQFGDSSGVRGAALLAN
ncbi:ROK family protein [Psychromonas ingrahamii 37]|uniref:ROK family protein n=1 Tax=Psychromonas ingrahamii (strain DSM 17664 / CCUG 51855 / 37) TaxID=357804 RepID=A1SUJ2_PSYIN|nr:ROK family protein [Psychromonas ingrahamii]ABM03157.1 ROK family protein [Psychromonas ingrahamii 37]